MANITQVTLTMEQQAELEHLRSGSVTPELLKQLEMVDLANQRQIAQRLNVSWQLVYRCLRAFLDEGFEALPVRPASKIVLVRVRLRHSKEGQATNMVAPTGRRNNRISADRIAPAALWPLLRMPQGRMTIAQGRALLDSLLSMTDNAAQMRRLLNLVQGDALMLERLLNLIGSTADVESFLALLGGNARVLVKATRFFGGGAEIRKIMAAATTVTIDPASLDRLFTIAQANGWSQADNVVEFLTKVHGASPRPSWQDALDWTDLFHTHNAESLAIGSGSTSTLATTTSYTDLALAGGPRRIGIMEYDLNHYRTGHTFEDFVMTGAPGNANIARSPISSLWPVGTSASTILVDARQAILNSQMLAKVQAAIANGKPFAQDTISVGGYKYVVGIDLNVNRLTQFYPSNAVSIPREVLRGIKVILGRT